MTPARMAIMIKALRETPEGVSTADLMPLIGATDRHAIEEFLRALRQAKQIYIASWGPDSIGRITAKRWRLGRYKDAVRVKVTHAQYCRDYRARRRKEAEALELHQTLSFIRRPNEARPPTDHP